MFKLIHNFRMWYSPEYRKAYRKKLFAEKFQAYESAKREKDEWRACPELMVDLINMLDTNLLIVENPNRLKEFTLYTGFINIEHMLNWLSVTERTVKAGIAISTDLTDIRYKRAQLSLHSFLSSRGKVILDINHTLDTLKELLIALDTTINNSSDGVYRTMVNRTISEIYRDIFAYIEAIIKFTLENERE